MCQLREGSNREGVLDRGAEDREEGVEGESGKEDREEISMITEMDIVRR